MYWAGPICIGFGLVGGAEPKGWSKEMYRRYFFLSNTCFKTIPKLLCSFHINKIVVDDYGFFFKKNNFINS